jgi:hypothetical protein
MNSKKHEELSKKIIQEIKTKFPKVWVKPGPDFNGGSALVWSGENAFMPDGMPAFKFYFEQYPNTYEDGVHKDLVKLAKEHKCIWECFDPGTYLLFLDA